MNEKLKVLIPAGGRSSRSGLSYPKTLYRLNQVPILIRIFDIVSVYDAEPVVIINPAHKDLFAAVLSEFNRKAVLVFQSEPKGMGNAILQASPQLEEDCHIVLIWSDIPLLNTGTLKRLIDCHLTCKNDFSLITSLSDDCYTIVERKNGSLVDVKETKALGIQPAKNGERDIGVFVFRKQGVFEILQRDAEDDHQSLGAEHGFLYAISIMVEAGKKVEGYPIALPEDVLSFNTPDDLKRIENSLTVM